MTMRAIISSSSDSSIAYIKKPIIGFAGDSISLAHGGSTGGTLNGFESAFYWAIAKHYPCDVVVGGAYQWAVGGKTSTQILSEQLASVTANPPTILVLNGGTNDASISANYGTTISNLQSFTTSAIAAGVKAVLILPFNPKNNVALSASEAAAVANINHAMQNFSAATAGAYFIDYVGSIIDPASTVFAPIGGNTGLEGAYTNDGLHHSTLGVRAIAPFLTPFLQEQCRPRKPRAINQADIWSATNNTRGNMLGNAGCFVGTNGTLNSVPDAGIAAGWTVTTAQGITATPSLVTSSYIPGGHKAQKFDLSGTASGTGIFLTLSRVVFNASLFTGLPKLDFEAVIRNNATGLQYIKSQLLVTGGSSVGNSVGGGDSSNRAASDLPTADETLFNFPPTLVQSVTGNNQIELRITLGIRTGVTISGSVEIAHAGVFAELV